MTDLNALIERLEKATGPDRELDILIGKATSVEGWRVCDDGSVECYVPDGHEFGEGWIFTGQELPAYTSSIDAAMTLVPEGWTRAVDATVPEAGIDVDLYPEDENALPVQGTHDSEPIATCIAALRSRSPQP